MKNLVLITSVINTPNNPLSYSNIRSIFTREERFFDTKKTIESVKKFIPNCSIILVECSEFNIDEINYFNTNVDIIINLWNFKELHHDIFGISKSLSEGTMTIKALEFIQENNIIFDNFFKISGRYYLNNNFNYEFYLNNYSIFKKINNCSFNILTVLYKLSNNSTKLLLNYLYNSKEKMTKCVGYEIIFGEFIKEITDLKFIETIGVEGRVSVCGTFFNG